MRDSSGRPGALTRLRRRPLDLIAVVLIAGLAVGTASLSDSLRVTLTSEVDANWRGSYDILVRPPGSRLDLETTHQVIEPNFLGFAGSGGIGLDQLNRIRAMADVELAAPVAFVGYIRSVAWTPNIVLDEVPARPTLYRATITATSSDGLTERLLQRETARILIGPLPDDRARFPEWATDLAGFSHGLNDGRLVVVDFESGHALPAVSIPVLAVDPTAEAELLGGSGGFLESFSSLPDRAQLRVETMDTNLIPPAFSLARTTIWGFNDPQYPDPTAKQRPIIPLVVSSTLYVDLKLRLDVEQLGAPMESYPAGDSDFQRLDAAEGLAGEGVTPIGTSMIDVGSSLLPFELAQLTLVWPGSDGTHGSYVGAGFAGLETRLSDRPVYGEAPGGADSPLAFAIQPAGIVGPDSNPAPNVDPNAPRSGLMRGRFPAYRSFTSYPLEAGPFAGPDPLLDAPFVYAPIGEFDPAGIDLPVNPVNYVPLGAYHPPDTIRVADEAGNPVEAMPMTPDFNPVGLVAPPPLAITDIEAARLLRGNAPIDAIRVRVRGLSGFDAAARAKVEDVATAIALLALDVDIVAGSSPQKVSVFVPAYWVDSDPPTDLGWVTQMWTTLGATSVVSQAFGATNAALGIISLAVALLVVAGLQSIGLASRRGEVAVLRSIGWPTHRITSWLVSEALIGTTVILGLGAIGWALGARNPEALTLSMGLALAWGAVAILGALWVIRRASLAAVVAGEVASGGRLLRAVPVVGPGTFGLRSLVARPLRTTIEIIAIGSAAALLSLAVLAILGAVSSGGPTLLSAAVGRALEPLQLGILLLAALMGSAFAVAAMRSRSLADAGATRVLIASGWSSIARRRLGIWTAVLTLGPALVIAAVIAGALASALSVSAVAAGIVAVAVCPALVSAAWLSLKLGRHP